MKLLALLCLFIIAWEIFWYVMGVRAVFPGVYNLVWGMWAWKLFGGKTARSR